MNYIQKSGKSFYETVEREQHQRLKKTKAFLIATVVLVGILVAIIFVCSRFDSVPQRKMVLDSYRIDEIPDYTGNIYCVLNNNKPTFDTNVNGNFEQYGELDAYGRCTVTFANICKDIMPTEERGEIGQIKPSGWVQKKYPGIVDSEPAYLYNRCHLIGYQLSGENANEKNLITGTRYFNVEGMLPFENMVRNYIDDTGNHVLYRVIPIFEDENLIATGVVMEAWSLEDEGKGVCFNVFVYNVQPGITIDYATGESWVTE